MKVFFEHTSTCDQIYFYNKKNHPEVSLPLPILLDDFISLVQCSLDQLKYVLILNNEEAKIFFSLENSQNKHIDLVENRYIFLNFSIRNQLDKFKQREVEINNFNHLYELFNNKR